MVLTDKIRRSPALLVAVLMIVATVIPLLSKHKANAYGLLGERTIQISSSKQADTDVSYVVSFKNTTAASTIGGVVVEFCINSPIIGDACTAPTGLNINYASLVITGASAAFTGAGFAIDTTDPDGAGPQVGIANNRLVYTTATPATGIAAGAALTFTLGDTTYGNANGVTNPDNTNANPAGLEDNITFYARILTFDDAVGAEAYLPTDVDDGGANTAVDAGGAALSLANQLTITAKVQERLTFCIYTTGTSCATGTGSSITLGDANGVLDNNTEFTSNVAKYGVSTNANGGTGGNVGKSVVIRMRGGTLKSSSSCSDGDNGGLGYACSITPAGATAVDTASNAEYFGLCVSPSAAPLAAATPYDGDTAGGGTCAVADANSPGGNSTVGTTTNRYAFDDNNTTGTQSPYGQSISTFNASAEQTGTLMFVGDIGATTEPGVYTTTLTFIATGTY